jgi:hypothetical protein
MHGSFFVVFAKPTVTLDDAERVLARLAPTRSGNTLSVVAGNTMITIGLSDAEHVLVESAEIADMSGIENIAKCGRRFECSVGDLEAGLQDYTVLQAVQEKLQALTEGFVFLTWNGEVLEL